MRMAIESHSKSWPLNTVNPLTLTFSKLMTLRHGPLCVRLTHDLVHKTAHDPRITFERKTALLRSGWGTNPWQLHSALFHAEMASVQTEEKSI